MSNLYQDHGLAKKEGEQKVCIATTAYDNPDAAYTFAMARTREAMSHAGIKTAYFLLSGNCHVDDARNLIVKEFLESDCTDLVFIDADVSWQPVNLVQLCSHDVDMVGGVYPFRRKSDNDDMPVRMKPGIYDPDERGLMEVDGLPSGFMRIKRHVLERLWLDAKKHWNKKDRSRQVPILFERTFEDGIRWGGDLHFCNTVRDYGFKIYADFDMTLGHVAKSTLKDSLGSALRRAGKQTLRYAVEQIRQGNETLELFTELREYIGNQYGALEDGLAAGVNLARKADGPIIETGTGLSTVLMAAATDQTVYCLEHNPAYAQKLRELVKEAGVSNVGLCVAPIKSGWYDLSDFDLPEYFSLGFNDGPPRTIGSRTGFYEAFGDKTKVIVVDDTDDQGYRDFVEKWAGDHNRPVNHLERVSIIGEAKDVPVHR